MALTDETLKAVAAKAIFDSLGEEERALLVQGAIKDLMTVRQQPGGYGHKSKLEEAFEGAIYRVCGELAQELVKDDPTIKARIQQLFSDAMAKTFDRESKAYNGLVAQVGELMIKLLRGELRSGY